jgi:hypothetical protein
MVRDEQSAGHQRRRGGLYGFTSRVGNRRLT